MISQESPPNSPIYEYLTEWKQRICCVSSIQELRERQAEHACCCALLFDEMAGANSAELLAQLIGREHSFPVILVIDYPHTASTVRAMRNGAFAVLDNQVSRDALFTTLSNAMQHTIDTQTACTSHQIAATFFDQLGQKEWEVLLMVLEGIPNKSIAKKLNVSIRTIENRRKRIYAVTRVNCVAQLVRLAIKAGVIDP